MNKKKITYIILFLFFLLIFSLSPISGDDWGNYLEGSKGFRYILGQSIGMYFDWEGRILSRFLINILTYHKVLWNISNSLIVIVLIYYVNKLINKENKKSIFLLILLSILLINIWTFSQTFVWIAGNITYLFPITFTIIHLYILYKNKYEDKFILCLLFSIIVPLFVEHMAAIMCFINFSFLLFSYLKNKKIDKKLLLFVIFSIISTLLMFLSPGTKYRSSIENLDFNKLNIFGKINYNIPNFIYWTFIVNLYLNILMYISNIFIIKKEIKNKLLKILLFIFCFIPIISSICYYLNSFGSNYLNFFIDVNNIYIKIIYLLYLIISIYLLIKYNNKNVLYLFIIGIIGNIVMLLSPTWGNRTSLWTYLILCFSYILIIKECLKENKITNYFLYLITFISMIFYIIFYINIHNCYIDNLNNIKNSKSKTIKLISYPSYANCNINPLDEYHLLKFKEYYKIENKDIEFVDNKWHYLIFYKK